LRYPGLDYPNHSVIAISYRRQDSLPIAGRLYDRLQGEFGKGNVFMDFDSIPYGVDFRQHIKDMMGQSKVLVALIGPDWLGRVGRQKKRRIDDPSDFVRLEIAYALESKIPIIPVLLGNTVMPKVEKLPPDIADFAFRNAITLDVGLDFHHHTDRLVVAIHRLLIETARRNALTDVVKTQESLKDEKKESSGEHPGRPTPQQKEPAVYPAPVEPARPPREPAPLFSESQLLAEWAPEQDKLIARKTTPGGAFRTAETERTPTAKADLTLATPHTKPSKLKRRFHRIVALTSASILALIVYYLSRGKEARPPVVVNQPNTSVRPIPSPLPTVPNTATPQFSRTPAVSVTPSSETERERPVTMLPDAQLAAAKKNLARQKFQEAETAIAKDQLDTAQTLLEQANIYDPDQPYILELLGRVLARNNKMIEAGAAFRKAIQIDPNFKPAQDNLTALAKRNQPVESTAPSTAASPSAAASMPTASPREEPRLSATEVQDFVRQFVSANQLDTPEPLLALYADNVSYFDEGNHDRDYIRKDIERYIQRWPIRQDFIEGNIEVQEKVPGKEYSAFFKWNFYAENPKGQWSKGQFAIRLEVTAVDDTPKIVGITEQILQRRTGKNPAHSPAKNNSWPRLLQAPPPSYPSEANQQGAAGSGRFSIEFDVQGNATSVEIVQSTGNRILDANTISTLKRWHAVAGHPGKMVVPITYTKPNRPAASQPRATPAKPVRH
jgi:TonB family protein